MVSPMIAPAVGDADPQRTDAEVLPGGQQCRTDQSDLTSAAGRRDFETDDQTDGLRIGPRSRIVASRASTDTALGVDPLAAVERSDREQDQADQQQKSLGSQHMICGTAALVAALTYRG